MVHSHREIIDYVALNADRRRPKRTIGEKVTLEGRQAAVGRATTQSPCREHASIDLDRRLAFNASREGGDGHRLTGTDDVWPTIKVCRVTCQT